MVAVVCSRGVGIGAASVQRVPSKTSVVATSWAPSWPPATTILSPTTAAPSATRGWFSGGSSTQALPRSANTLPDTKPDRLPFAGDQPPITTISPW